MDNITKSIIVSSVCTLSLYASSTVLKNSNIRSCPSVSCDIVKVAMKNETIEVVKKIKDKNKRYWYKTSDGYIAAHLVKIDKFQKIKEEIFVNKYGKVKKTVNIRVYPDLKSDIVTVVNKNKKIAILNKTIMEDGKIWFRTNQGYIYHTLIDIDSNSKVIKYLKLNSKQYKIICEELRLSSKYPWYKTNIGWINNIPYLSGPVKNCSGVEPSSTIIIPRKGKPISSNQDNTISNSTNLVVLPKVDSNTSNPAVVLYQNNTIIKVPYPNMFIGATINFDTLSVTQESVSGSLNLAQNDTKATSYNIHAGVRGLFKNYQLLTSYDYIPLEDINIENYYISINYQLANNLYNPYIGLSTGVSMLKWKIDPLTSSDTKDKESVTNGFFGAQVGIEYYIQNNISIVAQSIYQEYFHNTKIVYDNKQTNISHDRRFGIGFGFRYGF